MAIIEYGSWAPDQPRLGNTCITATNVYPIANGYGPFKGLSAYTDALAASCNGVITFRTPTGNVETFAGTETKLYRRNGTTWTDVTNSAGYTNSTFWRFAIYGSRVVATNGEDNPQAFDIGSDTEFSDLPNAPKHRFPIVVRDVLVALDCLSGNEIQFSATNDSESWDAASGGGGQPIFDGGRVMGGIGGEFGVVIQQEGLIRMNFVGGDFRFTFDKIEGGVGCIARDSIVQYKGRVFYLSDEGFQQFNGAESTNISDDFVTNTFFAALGEVEPLVTDTGETIVTETGEEISVSVLETVEGALDPRNSCVIWKYPTSSGNKLIIYNYRQGKWSESDASVNCLHTFLRSSGSVLAGFDSNNKLTLFEGADLTSTVSTGDIQLSRDRGVFVRSVRGLVDAGHDITVGKKTDLGDTETTSTGSSNTNGKVSLRSHGRYHRFQVQPTASFTELTGIDIEASPSGRKV